MTRPDLTDVRVRARAWFEALRDRLCGAFEQLETDYRGPESDRVTPATPLVAAPGVPDLEAASDSGTW